MYAHTGTEYVQAKVWTALLGPNATRGIADYFVGPAFLAWFRMGNIKKWGGPMPATFLAKQHQLQLQILPRLHSLGIIGVLPAFAGFVPDALRYAYLNASIRTGSLWMQSSEYSGVDVLAATDPLFAMFIEGYRSAYSSSAYSLQHFYSADSFNENSPASHQAMRHISTTMPRQRTARWRALMSKQCGSFRRGRSDPTGGRMLPLGRISRASRTRRCFSSISSRTKCRCGMERGHICTACSLGSAARMKRVGLLTPRV